jgi:hypothetical protein
MHPKTEQKIFFTKYYDTVERFLKCTAGCSINWVKY